MRKHILNTVLLGLLLIPLGLTGCSEDDGTSPTGMEAKDPGEADVVAVDRFSDSFATLFKRSENSALPAANAAVDFDQAPFITKGLGTDGELIQYYNFDVLPTTAAPIYAFFREDGSTAVDGQLNVIGVIPGDEGYSDFWHVYKVMVPSDYEANTLTNEADILASGYTMEATNLVVNCPVVPDGSTAELRYGGGDASLTSGWYDDMVVKYFNFEVLTVTVPSQGEPVVPLSDILVSFNIDPGMDGGGPASGFMTESGMDDGQTHNVAETVPGDDGYSPFWDVDVYSNVAFDSVYDWATAQEATLLASGVALVNCPIVTVDDARLNPETASVVSVDRFSDDFATLFRRSDNPSMPAANVPIDFDQPPFITKGFGPSGQNIQYYNFDVLPVTSAPIFVLFYESTDEPVPYQKNIINVIPGDTGYNDFWHVHKVTVPDDYIANTITSYEDLAVMNWPTERTTTIVNCPVVPDGSTADLRYGGGDTGLTTGWYKDQAVKYFNFVEAPITVTLPPDGHPDVPLAEIRVCFNINPGETGGGPPSGFKTEDGTDSGQTHNVADTVPGDAGYSPYWDVDIYDNADFDNVSDWSSALNATILAEGAATVNCPIVSVQ